MNVLVFDIETIPDLAFAKRYHSLEDLNDEDATHALLQINMEKRGSDFLPLHFHRIIAISVVYQGYDKFLIRSLADESAPEAEIITQFFKIIDKYTPTLVSWNGCAFDLPILHYRAMLHSISAKRYFETGELEPEFRYNNYLSRYHLRHTDLMDVLSNYQTRAAVTLDSISVLLGLPGKMGMDGNHVHEYFNAGKLNEIRAYCETDVLNTFLVYLRYELIRGRLSMSEHAQKITEIRTYLAEQSAPHWQKFLAKWN